VHDGLGRQGRQQGRGAQGSRQGGRGCVSGNDELKNEGRSDQAESSVKQAGEKAKDAAGDVKDAFKK